jgi:hypothetical protein
MNRIWLAWLALVVGVGACGGSEDDIVVPPRPSYGVWEKVEPPGAVCGDGSQYKFFVNYSETSNNLVIAFEPGGACWDYESCSGKSGIRGAANVDGLEDDHAEIAPFMVPFFQRFYDDTPTPDWNFVYVPYCTGDVHSGNNVITYEDPDGIEPDLVFHHNGHDNVQKIIQWMAGEFESVPQMLVTGCSAGGAGSTINYYDIRNGMPGVERAYLLADSGPIFPNSVNSKPLHDKVRVSWNIDPLLEQYPGTFDGNDFGTINTMLATEFPEDRFAITYFRRDYNYSLYSYERFYDYPDKETIHQMWWEDTQLLIEQFDQRDNLAYYLPYWRLLNDSHCDTLITFAGSEIQEADITLDQYVLDLVDDKKPLQSYVESVQPGEDEPDVE